jgi:hypothetical protein
MDVRQLWCEAESVLKDGGKLIFINVVRTSEGSWLSIVKPPRGCREASNG